MELVFLYARNLLSVTEIASKGSSRSIHERKTCKLFDTGLCLILTATNWAAGKKNTAISSSFCWFFRFKLLRRATIFFSFTNYLQCFRRYGHIYFDFCYQQCEKSCKQTLTIPYNVQLNIIFKMQTCVYERKTKMALLPCICFSVKTSQFVSQ